MISLAYFVGLLITGLCVGNMEPFSSVHGFLVIGLGTMVYSLAVGMIEYLNKR